MQVHRVGEQVHGIAIGSVYRMVLACTACVCVSNVSLGVGAERGQVSLSERNTGELLYLNSIQYMRDLEYHYRLYFIPY